MDPAMNLNGMGHVDDVKIDANDNIETLEFDNDTTPSIKEPTTSNIEKKDTIADNTLDNAKTNYEKENNQSKPQRPSDFPK